MVQSITDLPWYLGGPACLLCCLNAGYCCWKILQTTSNGYRLLIEHDEEEEERISQGGMFRKWYLITTFLTSLIRAINLFIDLVFTYLVAKYTFSTNTTTTTTTATTTIMWYSGSSLQYLIQVFPSAFFLINQSYLAHYLSYILDTINGKHRLIPFPAIWIHTSLIIFVMTLLMVLIQERDLIVHSLLAVLTFFIICAQGYFLIGILSHLSGRIIALSTRKTVLRLEILVGLGMITLLVLLICRLRGVVLDYYQIFSAEDAQKIFCVQVFSEGFCCLASLLLLLNNCTGIENKLLTAFRRSNSLVRTSLVSRLDGEVKQQVNNYHSLASTATASSSSVV